MMAELLRDVKTEVRELPGVAAAVVLAVAVGVGCNVAFEDVRANVATAWCGR